MLKLVLLRLNLVNALDNLHLELALGVPDLAVLALHVLVHFAQKPLLLVDPQLHALQRVSLIGCHLLLLELMRRLSLVKLVSQILGHELCVLHRLLDLVDLVVMILTQLADFALQHQHLLCNVVLGVPSLWSRSDPFKRGLDSFDISLTGLHLERLRLHDVPHLVEKLLCICLQHCYLLLGLGQLGRGNHKLGHV